MYQTSAIPAHDYRQRPTWGKPSGYEGRGRMAEEQAGYTTGTPADAASAEPTETAQNISAFPQRTWTQVSNAFMQVAFSEFGLGATRTFLYILRYTEGFHQDSVSLSIDELCHGKRFGEKRLDDGTKLARTTVLDGLKELTAKHIITTTSTGRGRGIVSVYHILPPAEWRLCIGSNSLPIVDDADGADIGSDTLPINANIGSNSLPIQPIIGSKRLPPLNKADQKKDRRERKETANAGETAKPLTTSRASPSPARKSATTEKHPRKLNDEQLAAHRAEAVYINAVMAAFQAELNVHKLPEIGQQRSGARWFYTAGPDGQPIPADDLMEWYRLTKRQPFWRGKFLSLVSIEKPFTEHGGDLTAYRATIAQEATEGDHHATATRANYSRAYAERAASRSAAAQPDPHKDGRYAAFVD